MEPTGYVAWRRRNKTDHAHCPRGCDHPQPAFGRMPGRKRNGLYCMACWTKQQAVSRMVACRPETCDERRPQWTT